MSRKTTAIQCAAALLCLSALATLFTKKQVTGKQAVNKQVGHNDFDIISDSALASSPITAAEQPVTYIPISGPLASREAEISGLAWYEEQLILLPQYPNRLNSNIFALPKADILAFLEGNRTEPLSPTTIAFDSSAVAEQIEGFEGFEAIAFAGNQAFLTIEAATQTGMSGYVVLGTLAPDLSQLTIAAGQKAEVTSQSEIANMSEETLILTEDRVVAIHEANGSQITTAPTTTAFDHALSELPTVRDFPSVEYRITDATALDEQGRFWAINYFYEGDRALRPTRDLLIARYGRGATHRQQSSVERLVEFQYNNLGTTLVNRPPIQLKLAKAGRNWEGIARLDERGFLLATDKFPETMLGFVEMPSERQD